MCTFPCQPGNVLYFVDKEILTILYSNEFGEVRIDSGLVEKTMLFYTSISVWFETKKYSHLTRILKVIG